MSFLSKKKIGQEAVDEKKASILMLIIKKENLWKAVQKLKVVYDVGQITILKSSHQDYQDFFFVIVQINLENVNLDDFRFTIVHKKGKCYYTINALNELIKQKNNGIVDKTFEIDWDEFQYKILFLNKDKQLVILPTKLYKIIKQQYQN